MKTFFNRIHYSKISLPALVLWPYSIFYGATVAARNFLYDKNILKSTKLPAFVVSIGNLTTGGTGKTPVTSAAANYFISQNKKVAVISRGYGGKLDNKNTNIISDGEKIYHTADEAGDEPYWIADNSPGTIVITGKNRIESGKLAINKFGAEVLILDDGFQHRKLRRDIDIILIDARKQFGNSMLLPAGPLREPVKNIKRADKLVIVNKFPFVATGALQDKFKEALLCELKPEKPDNVGKALAFSGIAQPDSFFNALEGLGVNLVDKKAFPDHHSYSQKELETIVAEAGHKQAEAILTTEKDMVKIRPIIDKICTKIPIYALKLNINLHLKKIFESRNLS